jgi:hypothetical protein
VQYFFILLASLFLLGAAWLFFRRITVFVGGVSTIGHVETFETRRNDDSITYLPVISFNDQEGKPHRFTSVAGGSKQSPPIGSSVHVRYDPKNQKVAFISSFLHMWAAPIAFVVFGASCVVIAIQIR